MRPHDVDRRREELLKLTYVIHLAWLVSEAFTTNPRKIFHMRGLLANVRIRAYTALQDGASHIYGPMGAFSSFEKPLTCLVDGNSSPHNGHRVNMAL